MNTFINTPPLLKDKKPTYDPLSKLTPEENHFIKDTVNKMSREEVFKRLKRDLQTACEVELATIPIYLFSYYSINRDKVSGEQLTPEEIYANKAGAQIMSVAVEEMLHMSLASNLYFSLFGKSPALYRKSPPSYPTRLPHHKLHGAWGPLGKKDDKVEIPLGKFSYEQLWHFLQIENPGPGGLTPRENDWKTIGQFYSYIRCLLHSHHITDKDFHVGPASHQIQPYNYSPNNIDTVNPKNKFDPWKAPSEQGSAAQEADFENAEDSFVSDKKSPLKAALITVSNKNDAFIAIDTICDQGEGANHSQWDDPSHAELSHYYKFLSLQAQLEPYENHVEQLVNVPQPPKAIKPTMSAAQLSNLIVNFPDNPQTTSYPAKYLAISNFCNGLYQYMLIMTETIFNVPAERNQKPEFQSQKMYFNIALHRSMIWVLDKYIKTIRKIILPNGQCLAPTFEFVDLGEPKDAFLNLKVLGEAAIAAAPNTTQSDNIIYYINTALNRTQDGKSMHLPDVADYLQPDSYPFASAPAFPKEIGEQPPGAVPHACMGLNSCKGNDRFGKNGPNGNDPNQCAGQGFCSTAVDHTCHVQNDCKSQGGCGLYGTKEEMSRPGQNECRSLGSCATPINSQRFITNGEYQGTSVWKRAREVFREEVWPTLKPSSSSNDLPPVGGENFVKKNGDVFKDGPSYLWISDDDKERSNMTACGSSGMSGAGGCS